MLEVLNNNKPEGSRRERKKTEYRNKIIIAAMNLFSNKGFEGTSIAEIMKVADLGVGTFYNYFSNKDEIIMHLFRELNQKLSEVVCKSVNKNQNPSEQIPEIYEILGRELERNKGYAKVVYLELLRNQMVFKIIAHEQRWLMELLDYWIKAGQEKNYFRQEISAEKTVKLLTGTYIHAVYNWLSDDAESISKILAFDIAIILKGINK